MPKALEPIRTRNLEKAVPLLRFQRNALAGSTSIFVLAITINLLLPVAALAQSYDAVAGVARVTVCDKGQIPINVIAGTRALTLQLVGNDLDVVAWKPINPGKCALVYYNAGEPRSYLGFGFYDSHGRFVAGHAAQLPDFGVFSILGTPILGPATDRFCVREKDGASYRIAEHAMLNCATFRTGANDPGGYISFPTTLEINPRVRECNSLYGGAVVNCVFGDYYLDVTATAISEEIQIAGRTEPDGQSVATASDGPSAADQIKQQLAIAIAQESQRAAHEKAEADAGANARAEATLRGSICVPDDLLAEWTTPPPGGKMATFQQQLKESLRERAKLQHYDQTKWFTVDSGRYRSWNLSAPFQTFVTATDGGSCASGHHEYLPLTP
jgi:hypothetical protein